MYVNELDGDPYAEVQHILEVLQRGNPVKGISHEGGIIQIEQTEEGNIQIVIEELEKAGHIIKSIIRDYKFVALGIEHKRVQRQKVITERPKGGEEPGD